MATFGGSPSAIGGSAAGGAGAGGAAATGAFSGSGWAATVIGSFFGRCAQSGSAATSKPNVPTERSSTKTSSVHLRAAAARSRSIANSRRTGYQLTCELNLTSSVKEATSAPSSRRSTPRTLKSAPIDGGSTAPTNTIPRSLPGSKTSNAAGKSEVLSRSIGKNWEVVK